MSMEEKQNFQTYQDFKEAVLRPDSEKQISEIIKNCYRKNIPLEILGSGTKKNIGRNFQSEKTLDLSNYSGIIEYKPEELYIKVKAGTSIKEIKEELNKNNQHLAFEPTDFGPLLIFFTIYFCFCIERNRIQKTIFICKAIWIAYSIVRAC